MALSDEKREEVKALLATGTSKNDVAKKCGVSWATVDSISKEEPDKIENFREQKRLAFIDKLWTNMEDAIDLGHMKIRVAKESQDKVEDLIEKLMDSKDLDFKQVTELSRSLEAVTSIPLSHLSTYFGTLYDKQALMSGGKTGQIGIDGEVKHTHDYHIEQQITTDPDTAELLKQLWKRQANSA